jgi:hypothetical protein
LNTRVIATRLHQLKKTVHRTLVQRLGNTVPEVLLRRALNEAAEAAESTGFPLLVFPLLAEETAERVHQVVAEEETTFSPNEPASLAYCA